MTLCYEALYVANLELLVTRYVQPVSPLRLWCSCCARASCVPLSVVAKKQAKALPICTSMCTFGFTTLVDVFARWCLTRAFWIMTISLGFLPSGLSLSPSFFSDCG